MIALVDEEQSGCLSTSTAEENWMSLCHGFDNRQVTWSGVLSMHQSWNPY